MGVMSDHNARAFGAAARAFRRSAGTLGSGSSLAGAISRLTTSPASAPAASRIFRSTLSQWLFCPSGSSVARKGKPLMVPSTAVMPRDGSFALALFGRVRKVQEPAFAVAAGRKSFALKRILEAVLVILLDSTDRNLLLDGARFGRLRCQGRCSSGSAPNEKKTSHRRMMPQLR